VHRLHDVWELKSVCTEYGTSALSIISMFISCRMHLVTTEHFQTPFPHQFRFPQSRQHLNAPYFGGRKKIFEGKKLGTDVTTVGVVEAVTEKPPSCEFVFSTGNVFPLLSLPSDTLHVSNVLIVIDTLERRSEGSARLDCRTYHACVKCGKMSILKSVGERSIRTYCMYT